MDVVVVEGILFKFIILIQIGLNSKKAIGVDIDPIKIKNAKHNANIYKAKNI